MSRHPARAVQLAGLLLVLSGVPAAPSRADAEELTGYEAVASGTAVSLSPKVPALLPVEAPIEALVSLATATLSTGGQGYGRASTFFPGTPIAGIRPLIEVASGQRLPLPDYPVVVESREFEHATSDDIPGLTMSSDVDPDRAVVIADAGGLSLPGVVGVHAARTVSTSLLDGTTVSATATTTVAGLDVAGVVRIDTVTSTATTTSDATTATCEGSVVVDGVTVGDQAATVDRAGIHLQSDPLVPNPAEAALADLEASGIEVRTLGGADSCAGAAGNRSSSGLLISVPLPSAGSIPPGGKLTILVASAYASASASTLPPFEPSDSAGPTFDDVAPYVPGPSSGGALEPVALPPISAGGSQGGSDTLAPTLEGPDPVAYSFGGVPPTLLGGLLLLSLPLGQRVRRYMALLAGLLDP